EGYRRVLQAYRTGAIDLDELYVVDPTMRVLAATEGSPPTTPDAGLRAALFGREQYTQVQSRKTGRSVVVTSPIAARGDPDAALRVGLPLRGPELLGGRVGFLVAYTVFTGALAAFFGFVLLRRQLVDPINQLRGETRRIAEGEFGQQVQLDAAREIQDLCSALSTMSSSLASYQQRTAEQVDQLERANTELREAQNALVRSEKLAGVGRLAAGLAHELGNPLAAVSGFVDVLLQGGVTEETRTDLLERSSRELDRIQLLIRELLDYARPAQTHLVPTDVENALREAVATVEHQPAFRNLRIDIQARPPLGPLLTDPEKLHHVLVNLLLNAADAATNEASPDPSTISLHVQEAAGIVEIRVEDEGPGFAPEALDRAFEPFFTTREVGEGTGLGLATCLQVVEAAGGTIQIENRSTGGACVRVRLPVS
ncbi:MAG: ATP-binding protein, partial [Myxococcota bacterium]|nr:ATP-binding protein [Myxococcota bacterium]